uniref:EF-hand domain-containing protein n=1 Tax=Noctiluca scintillans TaxID=2966 RepID=A0A7S1AM76_NOCSC
MSWWEVEMVLLEVHPVYGLLFVVYIATMVLSLLNIVTGICVNNALEMAQLDHDLMLKFELDRKAAYIESLEGLFSDLDASDSGTISFEDFTKHLERHEVSALFSVLGIEVSDAISFFEVLDVDGSHELEIDEFVMGCMRFRGNANLECSMLEAKQLMVKSMRRLKRIQEKVALIEDLMENLCLTHEVREPVPDVKARQRTYSDELFRPPVWASDETSASFTLGAHTDDPPSMTPHVNTPIFDE